MLNNSYEEFNIEASPSTYLGDIAEGELKISSHKHNLFLRIYYFNK